MNLPCSLLGSWEKGGLENLDIMAGAILQVCADIFESMPEDLRALLIYLSMASQTMPFSSESLFGGRVEYAL